ncbi:MAG: Phosphoserine phosphatase [Candidatus Methanolliviera sp. GoM_asphalt]|nr:MAG: Phosphoserine phosphatase [Candidatus Methanolliviera sp. GoM_asphalt]
MIVFDLDGTLIDGEVIDEVAKAVGKGEKVSKITRDAMKGEIDYDAALKKRVEMLKGLKEEEMRRAFTNIPLMNGARKLTAGAKNAGYKIAIITGSFKSAAEYFGDLLGANYVISNELAMKDGIVTGRVKIPIIGKSKSLVFERLCEKEGIDPEDCIVIGDGANDLELFGIAGRSIAFDAPPILHKAADIIIRGKDLTKVIPFLKGEEEEIMDNLIRQKKILSMEVETFKQKRDELNSETGIYAKKRDELNKKTGEFIRKSKEHKQERDKGNKLVRDSKKKRSDLNKRLKLIRKKIENLKATGNIEGKDLNQLKVEIDRLGFEQQTRVLTIEKERDLVRKICDLEEEYNRKKGEIEENEELRRLLRETKDLKEKNAIYRKSLSKYSDLAQEHHNKMMSSFKEADKARSEADLMHKKFMHSQKDADFYHHKFINNDRDLRDLENILNSLRRKGRDTKKAREERRINKIAEEVYSSFKKGEKITTEDLLLFQRGA